MSAVLDRQPSTAAAFGLHGQRFDTALARCAATELFATWALVLVITSVAVAASLSKPIAGAPGHKKWLIVAVRSTVVHSRIIVDADWVPTCGGEARVAL